MSTRQSGVVYSHTAHTYIPCEVCLQWLDTSIQMGRVHRRFIAYALRRPSHKHIYTQTKQATRSHPHCLGITERRQKKNTCNTHNTRHTENGAVRKTLLTIGYHLNGFSHILLRFDDRGCTIFMAFRRFVVACCLAVCAVSSEAFYDGPKRENWQHKVPPAPYLAKIHIQPTKTYLPRFAHFIDVRRGPKYTEHKILNHHMESAVVLYRRFYFTSAAQHLLTLPTTVRYSSIINS